MGDPINLISQWFNNLLLGWGWSQSLVTLISLAIGAFVVVFFSLSTVI